MQQSNEKQKVKKPAPDQNQTEKDDRVTGQKNQSNNDGSPTRPMKNDEKEEMKKSMGSGKRQDDN